MALTLFGEDISGPGFERQSFSGLPKEFSQSILEKTVPQFLDSLSGYKKGIDESTRAAADLAETQARGALKGGDIQKLLNSLSGRGVLRSKVGGEAIGEALSDIINRSAERTQEAALAGTQLKTREPELLGSAINLARATETVDPLASFRLLSDLYQGII
jgi:hypothetical protein